MVKPLGYARIHFSNLEFQHRWGPPDCHHDQIDYLIDLYQADELGKDNIINAIIPVDREAPLNLSQSEGPSPIELNRVVYCLDGYARIAAARKCLSFGEQWWTVRLYAENEIISKDDLKDIPIESSSYALNQNEGLTYRRFVLNSGLKPAPGLCPQGRDWYRGTTSREKTILGQLGERSRKHLRLNLIDCLQFPGVRHQFSILFFKDILSLQLDEVSILLLL